MVVNGCHLVGTRISNMKIRLVETVESDLLEDVKEEYKEQQEVLDEVRTILTDAEFEESKKLNGVAFVKEFEIEDISIKAQMYVDTTTYEYSCYISSTDNVNISNFSSKGEFDNLITAAKRLVFEMNGI